MPYVSKYRHEQFDLILGAENVDLTALRKLSWNGVPSQFRTVVWQLELGYLPTNKSRREMVLLRKRKEYFDSIPTYFNTSDSDQSTLEGKTSHQILVDLKRTSPNIPLFQQVHVWCMHVYVSVRNILSQDEEKFPDFHIIHYDANVNVLVYHILFLIRYQFKKQWKEFYTYGQFVILLVDMCKELMIY